MLVKQGTVKVLLLKKKWWSAALCLFVSAVIFYVVNYPAAVGTAATARQLPIYCVQRDQKMVSISFDAAWGDVRVRKGRRHYMSAALALLLICADACSLFGQAF